MEPFMLGAWQAASLARELTRVLGDGSGHDSVLLEWEGVDVVATVIPTMGKIAVGPTGEATRR